MRSSQILQHRNNGGCQEQLGGGMRTYCLMGSQLCTCPKGPRGGAGAQLGTIRESSPAELASTPGPEKSRIGISLLVPTEPFIPTLVCTYVFIGLASPARVWVPWGSSCGDVCSLVSLVPSTTLDSRSVLRGCWLSEWVSGRMDECMYGGYFMNEWRNEPTTRLRRLER